MGLAGLGGAACGDVVDVHLGDGHAASCGDASAPPCRQFAAPAVVQELVTGGDEAEKPTLTKDRLEIYFLSPRAGGPGGGDVWRATRADSSLKFDPPVLVDTVSTPGQEKSPAIAGDGLSLWVASDRMGGQGGLDIWVATRAPGGQSPWSVPTPVTELNSPGDEIPRPPAAASGRLVMPLARRANALASYQIFTASHDVGLPWSTPARLDSIDTATLDVDGYLTNDGSTLYFSSDRLTGTQDLFVARGGGVPPVFATPKPLAGLNTPDHDERDPWVSDDESVIYFVSNRTGKLLIYSATR